VNLKILSRSKIFREPSREPNIEKLILILGEAALELVPPEISNHPAVISWAKRRGKKPTEVLLDMSFHYKALRSLDKWYKRGRPDIVHICLLNALSSPLNLAGLLKVYIHTIRDIIIDVNPSIRLPRNYLRFVGLMEQLLVKGGVPPSSEKKLMTAKRGDLKMLLRLLNPDYVILMHERGLYEPPRALGSRIASMLSNNLKVAVIVGGFQHGDFEPYVFKLVSEIVSIFPRPLDAWIVVSRIIESVESMLGLYNNVSETTKAKQMWESRS